MTGDPLAAFQRRLDAIEAELLFFRDHVSQPIASLQRHYRLTRTEAAILYALMPGRVISAEWMADHCTASNEADAGTIRTHIANLRQKIGPVDIITIREAGYQLESQHIAAVRIVAEGRLINASLAR